MYRFDDLVVDPRAREVRRGGEVVHLEPQAFDLLVHLIEHRDEVVPKQRLLDAVWGHGFVTESALTTRIKEIRRALGDDGTAQRIVRNVRGRGYRFVASLSDETRSAAAPHGLVGRDEDLDAVVGLLGSAPVVTLVGPGGVGKSALARAVLDRVASPAGYLVELAPVAEGEAVLPALARALDTVFDGRRRDQLVAAVARREALLVLDNCEHVVDDVAALVDGILSTLGRRLRILATSQVRLGVTGEHVIGLAPLETDDAVALFVERAGAVRLHARPDVGDADRERLSRLVEHLDRLPLTIEMAAGRLSSMTLDDLESAVRDTGLLTRMSHRTATARHRTLASMVEWSSALLPPEQRDAFARMSVFAGAVTASDAAAVVGADAGLVLPELAERSLLAADLRGPTARYRMLETVRAVAAAQLSRSDSGGETARRHASWVAQALHDADVALRGVEERAGRRRLWDIVDELRVAHRWARENDPDLADRMCTDLHVAAYNRLWGEPAAWATEMVDAGRGTPGATLLLAGAAANAGELDRAAETAESVLRTTTAPHHVATALDILSDVALYRGRFEEVDRSAAELVSLGDGLGDTHWVALATVSRSLARTFGGDGAGGLAALDVERTAMSTSSIAWLSYAAGEAHAALGTADAAAVEFERAIALGEEVDNPFVMSVSHSALATVLARTGSRREACAAYESGLTSALRHGNLVHGATMVRNLAELLGASGEGQPAAELTEGLTQDVDAAVRRAVEIVRSRLAD
jgi:predicted ATPase/DNA-binding winged helix-turn-helix (wHTH) protein